jgi:hypothetical protein
VIRAKITPRFAEDSVTLVVEWVEILEGEQVGKTLVREEFSIARRREGCSYVTRGGFDEGRMQPGTFWIDEEGRRHFVVQAEAGVVGLIGKEQVQR